MKKVVWIACLVLVMFSASVVQGASAKEKERKVYIYLLSQTLRCYQGNAVVFSTHISSGKGWHASGSKKEPRYRAVYHVLAKDPRGAKATSKVKAGTKIVKGKKVPAHKEVSTPWKSILSWDYGHYVRMHGYHKVPKYPDSRGCFRELLKVAERIYNFVIPKSKDFEGTPVYIEAGRAPKLKK